MPSSSPWVSSSSSPLSSSLPTSAVASPLLRHPLFPLTQSQPPTPTESSFPGLFFVGEEDIENDEESVIVVGLDRAVINSYPKFLFSKKVAAAASSSSVSTICSICLCEYRDLEMLRMMPECRHYFHVTCIDAWLKLNGSCPVCRSSPLPTPISTPLSELVPLSQYDGDRRRRR
ncbi:RING-H2 finger protein ATL68 [Hibiscus syriacus]|uniref:RING-H2 finger protein ATL68 n=1 Tax=Hibiscus syriacus TaxID=106335 RepID=A0A6A3C4I7_HIBSY|nr:RING-H2 finger protein ATL68 [Hibiscus syriacus]